MNFKAVVMEKNCVFGIESIFKIFSVQNRFEFSQKFQRTFNACNDLKVFVNVLLKFSFNR